MGMIIEGLNAVRDFWNTLNDAAELGTGTTTETAQDTDIETVVSGSETTSITNTTADQFIVKEASFPGSGAGGESITEMIWKTQSPELAGSRITFINSSLTWQTDRDLTIETRWHFRGRRG